MKDIEIIQQLLGGYHLEPKELERAKQIVNNLSTEIDSRVK